MEPLFVIRPQQRGFKMKMSLVVVLAVAAACSGCSKLGLGGRGKSPPGVVTAYEPVTYYDRIRRDCGSACKLIKMRATHISSDGKMDLTDKAKVVFEFRNRKSTLGKKRRKSRFEKKSRERNRKRRRKSRRSSRSSSGKGKYERVIITIPKTGGSRRPDKMVIDQTTRPHNVKLTMSKTTIGPKCKMSELWKTALAKGADKAQLAQVTYDRDGYLFEIKNKGFKLLLDLHCKPLWTPSGPLQPVKDFPGVSSIAPEGAKFTGLMARVVRPDGTADTSTKSAWVRYQFVWQKPLKRMEKMEIMLRGGEIRRNRSFLPLGSKPKEIPPPKCAFSDLWQKALKKGADKNKTARIAYDITGYSFRQEDPLLTLGFSTECMPKAN
jgi:hypothetical protein